MLTLSLSASISARLRTLGIQSEIDKQIPQPLPEPPLHFHPLNPTTPDHPDPTPNYFILWQLKFHTIISYFIFYFKSFVYRSPKATASSA